jgi:hypothetical protein
VVLADKLPWQDHWRWRKAISTLVQHTAIILNYNFDFKYIYCSNRVPGRPPTAKQQSFKNGLPAECGLSILLPLDRVLMMPLY